MESINLVDKVAIFCAKRCSGKSELIKYLISCYKTEWNKIYVVSPTETVNSFYKKAGIADDNMIFEEWSETWIQSLITKMTTINANKAKEERRKILLICDDVAADKNFHTSKMLKILVARCRHVNITLIFTIQHLTMLPPICRSNSDYVFLGQLNNASVNIACDEFVAGNIDKRQFLQIYHKNTGNFNFLVINQNSIKDNSNLNEIYGVIRVAEGFI
jgi:hypothetical protein